MSAKELAYSTAVDTVTNKHEVIPASFFFSIGLSCKSRALCSPTRAADQNCVQRGGLGV